ncbi:hypothetical protein DFH07DRAFT_852860 [Mycena maculata]|uniref:Uncharacterized protein n=1 Tax=Mycena maculata TaxID=230809 RepID=A0AAD7MQD7_9AGAR|nr:hypothetical protein DFH07DRAFT_860321 [Mycena maculata]KAJ7726327.1 hypothetical protein DFH07DRAFT_852860 [Mycena maculata]
MLSLYQRALLAHNRCCGPAACIRLPRPSGPACAIFLLMLHSPAPPGLPALSHSVPDTDPDVPSLYRPTAACFSLVPRVRTPGLSPLFFHPSGFFIAWTLRTVPALPLQDITPPPVTAVDWPLHLARLGPAPFPRPPPARPAVSPVPALYRPLLHVWIPGYLHIVPLKGSVDGSVPCCSHVYPTGRRCSRPHAHCRRLISILGFQMCFTRFHSHCLGCTALGNVSNYISSVPHIRA